MIPLFTVFCPLIKQSDCSLSIGCKWCKELNRCMNSSIDCSTCNSLSKDYCELSPLTNRHRKFFFLLKFTINNSSCRWCEVGYRCMPSWSTCPTCSDLLESECHSPSLCGWCKSEQKCAPLGYSCAECLSLPNTNCTKDVYPGCHQCFVPLRYPSFICVDKSSQCLTCSSFSNPTDCYKDPDLDCRWCDVDGGKCYSHFSPCNSVCTGMGPSTCKSTYGCRFCEFLQECVPYSSKTPNCNCRDINEAACDSATGCALCDSSNDCRLKSIFV